MEDSVDPMSVLLEKYSLTKDYASYAENGLDPMPHKGLVGQTLVETEANSQSWVNA